MPLRRPARVTITNVESANAISAQYNPDEIGEKLGVAWNALEMQGLSHQPKQYKYTKNLELDFELGFDALSTAPIDVLPIAKSDNTDYARRFLHSLCYPRRGAGSVAAGQPPRVLFTWPTLFSLTCGIDSLDFKHKRFTWTMKDVLWTVRVTVSEWRVTRLYSEDVLEHGTIRSA